MREFFTDEGNGDVSEYQAWLQEHPDGRVLCLNEHGRDGKYIVHRSTCRTISYDTRSAGHDRSPMVCCGRGHRVDIASPRRQGGGVEEVLPAMRLSPRSKADMAMAGKSELFVTRYRVRTVVRRAACLVS
jgi:hypothetical protein